MKLNLLLFVFFTLSVIRCTNSDSITMQNARPTSVILTENAWDNQTSSWRVVKDSFEFVYNQDQLTGIYNESSPHILFSSKDNRIIEKKHFNNLEQIYNTDSLFYDASGRLTNIKTYSIQGHVQDATLEYVDDRIHKFILSVFYPSTITETYTYAYTNDNVTKVELILPPNFQQSYTYTFQPFENATDLNFFINNLYSTYPFGLNGISAGIIFSQHRIQKISDLFGSFTTHYEFQMEDDLLREMTISEIAFSGDTILINNLAYNY